jgi:hypothetical protein
LKQKEWAFLAVMVPAIRFNLFVFKEKTKRISTSIGAKWKEFAFLQLS